MEQALSQLLALQTPWMKFPSTHDTPTIVLSIQGRYESLCADPMPERAERALHYLGELPEWDEARKIIIPPGTNAKTDALWEKLRTAPPQRKPPKLNQVLYLTENLDNFFLFHDSYTTSVYYSTMEEIEDAQEKHQSYLKNLFPNTTHYLRLTAFLHCPAIATMGYIKQFSNAVNTFDKTELRPLFHDTHRTFGSFFFIDRGHIFQKNVAPIDIARKFRQDIQIFVDAELAVRRQLLKSYQKELFLKFNALVDSIKTAQNCSFETSCISVSQLLFAAELGMLPPAVTAKIHQVAQILLTPKQCPPHLLPDQLRIDALKSILSTKKLAK